MWFDLSQYQGTIDFEALSKITDLEGCIIRVQAGYTHPDSNYKTYVAGCKKYGIPFGTYAAALPISVNDAIKEADSAFNLMDKDSKFFAVDAEVQTCRVANDYAAAIQAYVDRMKAMGVQKVGKYSYVSFYNSYGLGNVRADFVWMADYDANDGVPHTPPTVPCDLWQYTSMVHEAAIPKNTVDVSKDMGTKPRDYFGGRNVYVGITTGGYTGANLGEVHQFVFDRQWYFDVSKNSDNTITFWIGGFLKDEPRVVELKNFLTSKNWWFKEDIIQPK